MLCSVSIAMVAWRASGSAAELCDFFLFVDLGLSRSVGNLVNKATKPKPASTPQIDADVAALDAAFKGVLHDKGGGWMRVDH